jgi:UPF0271 protein
MALHVNLNADMGEGYGAYDMGADEELLRIVASASIACGLHGGDPTIMRRLIARAREYGVSIGAHPGFNDLWGFGRRAIAMDARDLENLVAYQVAAMDGMVAAYGEGLRLTHVKPHGALYNMAAVDPQYAWAIAAAVRAVNPSLILVGLPASKMERAAEAAGLGFAREGFCDRAYAPDGTLISRSRADAVLRDHARAVAQARRLVCEGRIIAADGSSLELTVDTLCLHGDHEGAAELAAAVRAALIEAGVEILPLPDIVAAR